jgi:hypothetical protein
MVTFWATFAEAKLLHFHLNNQFQNIVWCRYFKVSKMVWCMFWALKLHFVVDILALFG